MDVYSYLKDASGHNIMCFLQSMSENFDDAIESLKTPHECMKIDRHGAMREWLSTSRCIIPVSNRPSVATIRFCNFCRIIKYWDISRNRSKYGEGFHGMSLTMESTPKDVLLRLRDEQIVEPEGMDIMMEIGAVPRIAISKAEQLLKPVNERVFRIPGSGDGTAFTRMEDVEAERARKGDPDGIVKFEPIVRQVVRNFVKTGRFDPSAILKTLDEADVEDFCTGINVSVEDDKMQNLHMFKRFNTIVRFLRSELISNGVLSEKASDMIHPLIQQREERKEEAEDMQIVPVSVWTASMVEKSIHAIVGSWGRFCEAPCAGSFLSRLMSRAMILCSQVQTLATLDEVAVCVKDSQRATEVATRDNEDTFEDYEQFACFSVDSIPESVFSPEAKAQIQEGDAIIDSRSDLDHMYWGSAWVPKMRMITNWECFFYWAHYEMYMMRKCQVLAPKDPQYLERIEKVTAHKLSMGQKSVVSRLFEQTANLDKVRPGDIEKAFRNLSHANTMSCNNILMAIRGQAIDPNIFFDTHKRPSEYNIMEIMAILRMAYRSSASEEDLRIKKVSTEDIQSYRVIIAKRERRRKAKKLGVNLKSVHLTDAEKKRTFEKARAHLMKRTYSLPGCGDLKIMSITELGIEMMKALEIRGLGLTFDLIRTHNEYHDEKVIEKYGLPPLHLTFCCETLCISDGMCIYRGEDDIRTIAVYLELMGMPYPPDMVQQVSGDMQMTHADEVVQVRYTGGVVMTETLVKNPFLATIAALSSSSSAPNSAASVESKTKKKQRFNKQRTSAYETKKRFSVAM